MAEIILRRADADSVIEERRKNGYRGFVSLESPTLGKTTTLQTQPAATSEPFVPDAHPAPISGPRDEKYVLVDGKYRLNPNYDPPFDITLGQAIAIPPLIGAGVALLPEVAAAAAAAGRFARAGHELKLGPNVRIAPFGNRTSDPYGKWPHYHRRPAERLPDGQSPPGQGIGRHRPWQPSKEHDKWPWDRF